MGLGPGDQAMSVGCGVGCKKEVETRGICDRLDVLAGTVEALDNASFANQPAKQDPNQNNGNKVTTDKATFLAIPRAQLSATRSIA